MTNNIAKKLLLSARPRKGSQVAPSKTDRRGKKQKRHAKKSEKETQFFPNFFLPI